MSTHGDGGKGSGRRNEDVSKVKSNWDLIDWSVTTSKKSSDIKAPVTTYLLKEVKPMEHNYEDDEDVICSNCGAEMSPTEHGRWLHCDVCGNTEDFVESDDGEDDSNYE